ncbi:MAG: hypothetical protein M3Q48_14715 [Actinomycetota bacterium]|nr:hypothetical protein [Actinomycetota bacterium]
MTEYDEVTIRIRRDIPPGLRDSLLEQLAPRVDPVVGNIADAQRVGEQEARS